MPKSQTPNFKPQALYLLGIWDLEFARLARLAAKRADEAGILELKEHLICIPLRTTLMPD